MGVCFQGLLIFKKTLKGECSLGPSVISCLARLQGAVRDLILPTYGCRRFAVERLERHKASADTRRGWLFIKSSDWHRLPQYTDTRFYIPEPHYSFLTRRSATLILSQPE